MSVQGSIQKNVMGEPMQPCCQDPVTGIFRDGFCHSHKSDLGRHLVCAQVTREFLEFSLQQGNDLITPNQAVQFPGLREGDRWCLCVNRWKEAQEAGVAPPVYLKATHEEALEVVSFQTLKSFALDIH